MQKEFPSRDAGDDGSNRGAVYLLDTAIDANLSASSSAPVHSGGSESRRDRIAVQETLVMHDNLISKGIVLPWNTLLEQCALPVRVGYPHEPHVSRPALALVWARDLLSSTLQSDPILSVFEPIILDPFRIRRLQRLLIGVFPSVRTQLTDPQCLYRIPTEAAEAPCDRDFSHSRAA